MGWMNDVADWVVSISMQFGYIGVFIACTLTASAIFLPLPINSSVIVLLMSATLNPFLLAFLAAVGNMLGELTGYALGHGGKKISKLDKKYKKQYNKISKNFEKYGGWLIIFFAMTPMPDDILGIFCGSIKYDIKKFMVMTFIGRFLLHLITALLGDRIAWLLGI